MDRGAEIAGGRGSGGRQQGRRGADGGTAAASGSAAATSEGAAGGRAADHSDGTAGGGAAASGDEAGNTAGAPGNAAGGSGTAASGNEAGSGDAPASGHEAGSGGAGGSSGAAGGNAAGGSSDAGGSSAAGASGNAAGNSAAGASGNAAGSSAAGASGSAAGNSAAGASGSAAGNSAAGGSGGAGGNGAGAAAGTGGSSGQSAGAGVGGIGGDPGAGGAAGSPSIDHDAPGVIVVLGSSTAAGTGPNDPNNAWVERYRAYLANEFKNFELINLAVASYSTWHEQPDDFEPPQGRPVPDMEHNITAALRRNPDAILINLPANDTATGTTFQEQMDNFARMTALADNASALAWVATTQPRNFGEQAQRVLQMQVRDAINAKYRDHALDFWTPLAEADGTIQPIYDSGDGVHMNDDAHALLAQEVINAKVPETILTRR